ncbi:hypothetical protein MKW98_003570 [Papaver atlanticum]|uniref:Uncharacterized protein n=1 Tax=Papaver atlanticum TaxID=357466 RepID=A0AAD4XUY3_9MAGN|nr:hypothetical protein MKW98_003570 [Papaver atlanticum]
MLQTEYDKVLTVVKIYKLYHLERGVAAKLSKTIIKDGLKKLDLPLIVKHQKDLWRYRCYDLGMPTSAEQERL